MVFLLSNLQSYWAPLEASATGHYLLTVALNATPAAWPLHIHTSQLVPCLTSSLLCCHWFSFLLLGSELLLSFLTSRWLLKLPWVSKCSTPEGIPSLLPQPIWITDLCSCSLKQGMKSHKTQLLFRNILHTVCKL